MANNPFEIPQALRDVSEQNIKQAHAAYEQLTDFVTKAMGASMGAMLSNLMATGFKDVQGRVGNSEEEAEELARWSKRSPRRRIFEILTIQTSLIRSRCRRAPRKCRSFNS